ncbi:MAG TPA: DNA primase [Chthoniobacterales bacterium]|jgi:DNA primase|nr:DNA primase [Chthoniobacterales bacterium]HEV3099905.1 DNA primase [Candidatus Udaeobacter sp.]
MGTIPPETIEQIAAANDIIEVISSYFPLKRAGANFKALCPFHQEKTPSFMISPSRQTFHCFGCGAGGSVFRFVMDYEHADFPSAVRKLAARAGITVVEERGAADEDRRYEARRTLLKLHADAAEWFHENLLKRDVGNPARKYLKQRGLTAEIAKHWQLGYAPDEWDAFGNWAHAQGYHTRDLITSGLAKTKDDAESTPVESSSAYDRFRGRIMFPICNDVGEVIAFSGRLLKDAEGVAKYLNSPETLLFRKGSVLFGLHKTKRALIEANCAIVCEGQLDLISLFEAGITNVVAPQGTAFTENQARVLKRFVNEVVLCFDADAAGQKAAERSLDALLQNDLIVRVAEIPAGEDPDSLVRREGKEAFESRVAGARDFFDYWIEREAAGVDLASLGAKMQLARSLAGTVSRVRDPLMRGEVASKVSARLGVAAQDFQALLSKQPGELLRSNDRSEADGIGGTAPPPRHDIAMLCLLALRDEEAREFLREQNWREILAQVADGEILVRILKSDLRPDDAASLNAFMVTLSPPEERLVSWWLLQKVPLNAAAMVEKWWLGIRQAVLRRQLNVATNQIKLPNLSTGEIVNLQKQILDLQEQLRELSQPAGPGDN